MGKVINLTPEALELLNKFCDMLEDHTVTLQAAEEQLQSQAFMESDTQEANNLYTTAYQVKILCRDLTKLNSIINTASGAE